jgi:hypothetical protein
MTIAFFDVGRRDCHVFFTEFMDTLDDDSSDDDINMLAAAIMLHQAEQVTIPRFRGSIVGHECSDHNRVAAHNQLWNDYFNPEGTLYTLCQFQRRFECACMCSTVESMSCKLMIHTLCNGEMPLASLGYVHFRNALRLSGC